MTLPSARCVLASGLAAIALAAGADATTITVVNLDGAGEGFNDATAVSPVGGNPGTTLGAQRLNAFQYAADIWEGLLTSAVEIKIDATLDPLPCSMTSAILGLAGSNFLFRDFPGALVAGTWYPQALANKLSGSDNHASSDIEAMFNSSVGTTCPFPKTWYYGLDGAATSSQTDFVTVVLHELGHGLGFNDTVDLATGALLLGFQDTYILNLEDHSTAELYPGMTDAERVTASKDTGDLHWVGGGVVAAGGSLTSGRHASGHIEMYAPNPQEPGSSVAHFSTSLSPDDVMEPFYTGPNHDVALAAALMTDIGWGPICGNGVAEGGEGCDDGNTVGGDCCSATCAVESGPCDDGDACTDGDACSGGTCVGGPLITACIDGDGCCPAGCDDTNDTDCIIVPTVSPLGILLLAALLGLALGRGSARGTRAS